MCCNIRVANKPHQNHDSQSRVLWQQLPQTLGHESLPWVERVKVAGTARASLQMCDRRLWPTGWKHGLNREHLRSSSLPPLTWECMWQMDTPCTCSWHYGDLRLDSFTIDRKSSSVLFDVVAGIFKGRWGVCQFEFGVVNILWYLMLYYACLLGRQTAN